MQCFDFKNDGGGGGGIYIVSYYCICMLHLNKAFYSVMLEVLILDA